IFIQIQNLKNIFIPIPLFDNGSGLQVSILHFRIKIKYPLRKLYTSSMPYLFR
ncbi:hypothetical protein NEICINOT_03504, partial [Neisseria cinerea ATCC 14685]